MTSKEKCAKCGGELSSISNACSVCSLPTVAPRRSKIFGDEEIGRGTYLGCFLTFVAPLAVIGLVLNDCSNERAKEQAEKAAQDKRDEDRYQREQDRKRASGRHCLDGWNNSNISLVSAVKYRLRDPDSFEHIESVITPRQGDGRHRLIMKYRARNGFGGMNINHAMASVDPTTCDATITATD